jgi:hypothetical protein
MSSTIINDHEGVCPRCKTNHCEDDNEYDNRVFWVSNTDGTEICRACVRKEGEDEDEGSHCGECGTSTQGRKIRGLWNNTLCEECGEEEEMCGVCHKTCKTDDTDDLVLITEINGVKHCDECLHAFLAKRAAK